MVIMKTLNGQFTAGNRYDAESSEFKQFEIGGGRKSYYGTL